MIILPVPAFKDNYIWCLVDEAKHLLFCVDPGDAAPVIAFAQQQQLHLQGLLITHHHADHVAGVPQLMDYYKHCVVYGPNDPRLPWVTHPVGNGDRVSVSDYLFKVLSIPGHTSSHIAYYEPHQGIVFTGDTLFSAGCGRVFDGTLEQLHQALSLLKNLPGKTKIYCGHEYTLANLQFAQTIEPHNADIQAYWRHLVENKLDCTLPSSIEQEQKINPFMRTDQPEVQAYALQKGIDPTDSLSIFKLLRKEKDAFSI